MLKNFLILWVIVLLLLGGVIMENLTRNSTQGSKQVSAKFLSYIEQHDLNQRLLVSQQEKPNLPGFFSQKINSIDASPFDLYISKGDSMVFWSSDKVAFTPFLASKFVTIRYMSFDDGFYRVCSKRDSFGYSYFALLKLAHNFPYNVRSLPQHKSAKKVGVKENVVLSDTLSGSDFFEILDKDGRTSFFVKIINANISGGMSLYFYFAALFFVLLLLAQLFVSKTKKTKRFEFVTIGFLFFVSLGLRIGFAKGIFLGFLANTPLFSPEIFAHSILASSLGEHFMNLLILCFLFLFLSRIKLPYKGVNPYLILLFFNISIASFLYWLLLEMRHLIYDSNINFDPIIIDGLDFYTILGVFLVGVYFLLLSLFCFSISNWIIRLNIQRNKVFALSFFIQTVAVVFVYLLEDNLIQTPLAAFSWVLLVLGIIFFLRNRVGKTKDWSDAIFLFLFTLLISFQVNGLLEDKEKEFRRLYAYKMLYERDLEVEMKLLEAEKKLEENNVFESCIYEDAEFNKIEFEEILKYDYLLDFLSDFDISIHAFSGNTSNWSNDQTQDYNRLYNLFLETSGDDLSNKFLKVREGSGFSGYLSAHTKGTFNSEEFRSVFIMLRQKVRSSRQVVSEFTGRSGTFDQNPYNYYHALYTDNVLNRVSPEFPFERFNMMFRPGTSEKFEEKEGLSYFIYNPEKGRLLVLVRSMRTFSEMFTVFSGLILILFTTWFLFLSLRFFLRIIFLNIQRKRGVNSIKKYEFYFPSFKSILLQSKIRTALFLELIISFVVITIMVANFISTNHTGNQQKLILEKVRGISADLEKSGKIDFADINGPKKEFLINLSESYNIDINLFDLSGKLWISSSPGLYKNALINEYMNPKAFVKMSENKMYSFNQNERIYGYSYRSYYQSLFDRNQQLSGYIHLPFFARQLEKNRELTSLLVSMVNIFVLFFFVTGLLSILLSKVITRPLSIIVSNIGKLKLGGKNEEIDWHSSDEIGQLVKTYNKVLRELEQSIDKLAATEREGAWREMAKQVAHEIKNPLTPMKLSVQHLQRSVQDSEPEVKEKIRKVSELLVNQIDMMSKMAEEFSAFAQMPVAKPEKININDLLTESIQLFEKFEELVIEYDTLGNNQHVYGDKDQIKRVFVNLIKNAHQARVEGQNCKLSILLKMEGDNVLLSFTDNGVGIKEDLYDKIFRPNFSTKNSGMGLGLAISKKIIELSDGEIWFESKEGKGTTFFIRLPIFKG